MCKSFKCPNCLHCLWLPLMLMYTDKVSSDEIQQQSHCMLLAHAMSVKGNTEVESGQKTVERRKEE